MVYMPLKVESEIILLGKGDLLDELECHGGGGNSAEHLKASFDLIND